MFQTFVKMGILNISQHFFHYFFILLAGLLKRQTVFKALNLWSYSCKAQCFHIDIFWLLTFAWAHKTYIQVKSVKVLWCGLEKTIVPQCFCLFSSSNIQTFVNQDHLFSENVPKNEFLLKTRNFSKRDHKNTLNSKWKQWHHCCLKHNLTSFFRKW